MLFQVYGDTAVYQWIGWVVVFLALIGFNEVARRTKAGGITCFLVIPAILTAYFIAIYAGAAAGADTAEIVAGARNDGTAPHKGRRAGVRRTCYNLHEKKAKER